MQPNVAVAQVVRTPKARLISLRHLDGRTRACRRARALARYFAEVIGGRHTATKQIAIDRAAVLVALAEDARARKLGGDLNISFDDLTRLDHSAARAVRELGEQRERPDESSTPTLGALMDRHR